jgi:GNAT superfamily N-acetyltransferase
MWASLKGRPLSLQVGLSYRLDFLEVTPARRGQSLGLFCLGLVAQRALEAGCSALVLEALPAAKEFYIKAGGLQTRAHGWNLPQGLIPFLFRREKLRGRECGSRSIFWPVVVEWGST